MINNIFDLEYVDRGYTYLDTWSGPVSQRFKVTIHKLLEISY